MFTFNLKSKAIKMRPPLLINKKEVLLLLILLLGLLFFSLQHPFIKSAKPNSILRALITDAMEIKMKIQEAEQREQDADDDDNSVQTLTIK